MLDFSDIVDGSRVRLVYEVDVDHAAKYHLYDEEGTEFTVSGLISIEKLTPKLPIEPGSIVTFRHVSNPDHLDSHFQAILVADRWLNIKLGGEVTVDRMVLISVDRVGV
jgi:hypothetical protein